jgi:hypothetical protein
MTIDGITGVSNFTVAPNTTAPTTPGGTTTPAAGSLSAAVFGGTAGLDGGGAPACNISGSVCDSCTSTSLSCTNTNGDVQTPLCSCNHARINNDTVISIQVTRAAGDSGPIRAYPSGNATSTTEMFYVTTPNANNSFVDFRWGDVCSRMNTATTQDCEGINGSVVITVYSDKDLNGSYTAGEDKVDVTFSVVSPGADENIFGEPNTEGVGDFKPFPGDDRIYLPEGDLNTTMGFPSLIYGSSATAIKIFLSDESLDKANAREKLEPEYDLTLTTDNDLSQNYFDGVENGKAYYMRVALLDKASNIVQYFPNLTATDHQGVAHPDCLLAGPPNPKTCPFAVIPDQVLGLLTKDLNCFIASAAYGSSLEPKLILFRKFRSDVLMHSDWGRKFIMQYYTYGPYAARFIADKPFLRAVTRGFLWPLAGFSWLALRVGLAKALAISLAALALLIAVPAFTKRRFSARA